MIFLRLSVLNEYQTTLRKHPPVAPDCSFYTFAIAVHKPIAYMLLVLFLFANTEAHELLKLPFLVEHFVSHNNSESQSVVDFLNEHYGNSSESKDGEHSKLPFKTHHSVSGLLVAELHQVPSIITDPIVPASYSPEGFKIVHHTLHNYLDTIWQPPKNA